MAKIPDFPPKSPEEDGLRARLMRTLEEFVTHIPETQEVPHPHPIDRGHELKTRVANRAALVSGGLALPPGPVGMLTVLPDLITVWKLQARLVADIAGVFGDYHRLGREQMLYCLFQHAAPIVEELVEIDEEGNGEVIIRQASVQFMRQILARLSMRVTQRAVSRSIARWVPFGGAATLAVYAWYETRQVGETTINLFSKGFAVDVLDAQLVDTEQPDDIPRSAP